MDASLRTNDPNIFAAGDVAEFFNPALAKYIRVEHEDNANTMGEAAGRSMAGESISYAHLPFFYSDLFELGYEAIGDVDARLETVADWKEPNREGVVYYLQDHRVRGVLLWNVWGRMDAGSGTYWRSRAHPAGRPRRAAAWKPTNPLEGRAGAILGVRHRRRKIGQCSRRHDVTARRFML